MKRLLTLLTLFILTSCSNSKKEWTIKDMTKLIIDKSDLVLPTEFKVIKDSVVHTPGAFDSDYTYYLTLKFSEKSSEKIKLDIKNSPYFNRVNHQNYIDSIWTTIKKEKKKGLWYNYKKGYSYLESSQETAEPFVLYFDTIQNTLFLELNHL